MVVVQLVEQWLLTPEGRGSNPVIDNFYIDHLITVNCIEKTKIKKKEAGNGPFFRTMFHISSVVESLLKSIQPKKSKLKCHAIK